MLDWLLGPDVTAFGAARPFLGLLVAFVLSSLIGLERERRQKSAGLRTHTLVGLGAALFMEVSKYGFGDMRFGENVSVDPSRVAAQIVSGIGFIGGGLIFVRRDAVRGLTTAAVVWVTAAVGMACGAGLPLLAVCVTGLHFAALYAYTPLIRRLHRSRENLHQLEISYRSGRGLMREVLAVCTSRGFAVINLEVCNGDDGSEGRRSAWHQQDRDETESGAVHVTLELEGAGHLQDLLGELSELDGLLRLHGGKPTDDE